MARPLPFKWLKYLRPSARQGRKPRGFTLLELLVAMFIGSLITVLLLSLVVELTQTNARDSGRSQVQQDMQAAIDYIAQDLREAVFVYNGQCLAGSGGVPTVGNFGGACPGVVNHIPATMNTATRRPVLAFWRVDPLPVGIAQLCDQNAQGLVDGDTAVPEVLTRVCIAGSTYSLVVYAIDTDDDDDGWQGKARIYRYKLAQFADDATTPTETPGYARPEEGAFLQWPYRLEEGVVANTQAGIPTNAAQVLVDFVDDGNTPGAPASTPTCNEFGANALTPLTGALSNFYACVRGGGLGATAGQNQDVLLTLVGSTAGLSGFPKNQSDNTSRLSPVQTRVLVRGIIQKK